jgi:hypothetical protein
MTYITNLNAYELHLRDKEVFNNFIDESWEFTLYFW